MTNMTTIHTPRQFSVLDANALLPVVMRITEFSVQAVKTNMNRLAAIKTSSLESAKNVEAEIELEVEQEVTRWGKKN